MRNCLLFLFLTFFVVSCKTTSSVDSFNYRTPKSNSKTLLLPNNANIRSEDDLKDLSKKLNGSTVSEKYGVYTWNLNGGVLDGKNQKGDGSQKENQEPLFRAYIPLIITNGFMRNTKNAGLFYKPHSGIKKITITNIGEDAIATVEGAEGFLVENCEFVNTKYSTADKSLQLNEGRGAEIINNKFEGGITAIRIFESSFTPESAEAYAENNKFYNVDTAINVSKGTLIIRKNNTYRGVRLPFKTGQGGKIRNADGRVEND